MENKRQESASSSSSSPINFDHLFGSKDSSSSSTSGVFGSIFSPPSAVQGRGSNHSGSIIGSLRKQGESSKGGESNIFNSKDESSIYQNESAEPCYFSSSIYYGGQENYSPRTKATTESHHHVVKKDGGEDDPNGNNSNSASRGNWWQGSLYY